MEILAAQLKEQAGQIQKVSAQGQLTKPLPETSPIIDKMFVRFAATDAEASEPNCAH